jgi:probable F420-dependent oxidoreductase
MMRDGLGVWTAQFDFQPADAARDAAREIESLGYQSLWFGENVGREPFAQAAILLAATNRLVVGTGIVNIWARDPLAMLASQLTLAEAYPGRFILGLGVSHARLVEGIRGLNYHRPLSAMRDYLDAMDGLRARYRAIQPDTAPRVLAALGPEMLALAAQRADGAHTYLVPPEHTELARGRLGAGRLLVVEQAVVIDSDLETARATARSHVRRYLPLVNYTDNLRRLGFNDGDFDHDGSDRLVDRLVACGDVSAVMKRVEDHRQAGADHVCIQVVTNDLRALPAAQWRRLAATPAERRIG